MEIRYVVEVGTVDEEGWEEFFANVYRVEVDGIKTEIGWIGGEPEDNTSFRTYSWIEGELNNAYQRGVKDGIERASKNL